MSDELADVHAAETQIQPVENGEVRDPLKDIPSKVTTKDLLRKAFKDTNERDAKAEPAKESSKGKDEPKDTRTTAERLRDEQGKFARADTGEAPKEAAPAPVPSPQEAHPAVKVEPPTSWAPEAKAAWATIPAAVQQAVLKRETEASTGIKKYSDDLKEIESILAPARPLFQQAGVRSTAEAVSRLMQWENWIRTNPRAAIPQLAAQYGVDLSTLVRASSPADQNADPSQELPPQLRPFIDQFGQVQQQVQHLASTLESERQTRASQSLQQFATEKDASGTPLRPHFDRVRTAMGQLLASGYATTLQDAYDRAIWSDPDIRNDVLSEQQAKREAEQRAALEKREAELKAEAEKLKAQQHVQQAKNASVSPRGSTPTGSMGKGKSPKGESVAATLRAVIKERQQARA